MKTRGEILHEILREYENLLENDEFRTEDKETFKKNISSLIGVSNCYCLYCASISARFYSPSCNEKMENLKFIIDK